MKILLLNQTFYPDVVATAQHGADLAAALAGAGHEVSVLCSRRAYDSPAVTYPAREAWNGVTIRRIWSSGFGKKTKWRRALDFGSFLANCLLQLLRTPRQDVVIAMTSPPLISWMAAWFTRLKGGRLLFWVMDLNPDEAIAAGWLEAGSPTARVLARMLRFSLDEAAAVVALDRFMAQRVEAKGIDASKITVVPPWPHEHAVWYDAAGRNEFRRAQGLDGKFVVMYSGNHSPCHPLTALLEAAARLRRRNDIAFCFVGGGSGFKGVQDFARERGLANIVTLPYQPMEKLSQSLSAADLHVVVMGDPYVGIVHPCKVYNIRTLGLPYLYIGPAQSHVTELNPTYSARNGDVDAIVNQIEAALSRTPECRSIALDYGHDELIARMLQVVDAARGQGPRNRRQQHACSALTQEDA